LLAPLADAIGKVDRLLIDAQLLEGEGHGPFAEESRQWKVDRADAEKVGDAESSSLVYSPLSPFYSLIFRPAAEKSGRPAIDIS
jgi:hypothetical protein